MQIALATPGCILGYGQRDKAGNSAGEELINQDYSDTSKGKHIGKEQGAQSGELVGDVPMSQQGWNLGRHVWKGLTAGLLARES